MIDPWPLSGPLFECAPLGLFFTLFTMNFSLGRVGRYSVEVQARQATDSSDGGTYNIGSLAYLQDFNGTAYQTSAGIALRQDHVSNADRLAQQTQDEARKSASKSAAKAAAATTNDESSTD